VFSSFSRTVLYARSYLRGHARTKQEDVEIRNLENDLTVSIMLDKTCSTSVDGIMSTNDVNTQ